ncbi:hypothetical protein CAPTEDRAFT_223051 [Capitella teleta]|uniref:CUB domain-containing protein n=1 Tax=Capitella teleta TaxID=283909 RepID=R7TW34_CAPTE|nr:hypothetical protein CAPTEDRAFT_223051 [Capitella teleta]|eukprot:ELT97929.1 hypothetical protein CAPTEDRAFT_223051 [Capitella teleta]
MDKTIIALLCMSCAFSPYVNGDVNEWACNANRPAILESPASIHSPPDPEGTNGYPHNAHCTWLIIAPTDEVVRIEFTEFDLESNYLCIFGNVTLHDGYTDNTDHDQIARYCGRDLPPVVHSAGNELFVTFGTGHSGVGTGFKADFDFVPVQKVACSSSAPAQLDYDIGGFVSPGYPHYGSRDSDALCSWEITPSADMRLEFDAVVMDADCSTDSITVHDGDQVIGVFCETNEIPPIGITQSSMLVVFKSSSTFTGFRARFKNYNITGEIRYYDNYQLCNDSIMLTIEWACGSSKPAALDWAPGYITSPSTEDSHCHWKFIAPEGKVVKLEIEYFDLPVCTNCGCASLSFYDGDNEYAPLLGEFCGVGWNTSFVISGKSTSSLLYENYQLAPHMGYKIKYSFYSISDHACGSSKPITLTDRQGLITSPGYGSPNGYPKSSDCQWQIMAKESEVIFIDYLDFGIEYCPGCACDRLLVYNGPDSSSPLAHTHCDFLQPPRMMSTVNSTFFRFLSDRDRGAKGFKIHFAVEDLADSACGIASPVNMNLQPGYVYSPNYGGYYPVDSRCEWLVTAPANKVVELSFQFMDIEFGYYCEFDYLAVYDGLSSSSPILRRICGRDQPANVSSTQNAMLLMFISNEYLELKGFKATYYFIDKPSGSRASVPAIICGVLGGLGIIVVLIVCFKVPKKISNLVRKWRRRNEATDAADSGLPPPYDDGVHPIASNTEMACPPSFGLGSEQYHQIAAYPPPTYEESFLDDHLQAHGLMQPPSYEDSHPPREPTPPSPPSPKPQEPNALAGIPVLSTCGMPGYQPPPETANNNQPVPRRSGYLHETTEPRRGVSNPAFDSSNENVPLRQLKQEKAQAVAAILQGQRYSGTEKPSDGEDKRQNDLRKFSRSDNDLVNVSSLLSLPKKDEATGSKRLSRGRTLSLSCLEFAGADPSISIPFDVADTAV